MSRLILAAVAAMAMAGASQAAAPAQNPNKADSEADWLRRPTGDELKAAFPVGLRGEGRALIRCRVNVQGLLENCAVESETPPGKGVGGAALLLAPNFQMKPAMKDGQPVTAEVRIPIHFSNPGAVEGPHVQALVRALWLQAPGAADLAAAYPKGAPPKGHAAVRCNVKVDGTLHGCEVLTEEPRGRGFGFAARSLAAKFKAYTDPSKSDYRHVQVTVPFAFEAAPPEPRYITAPDWRLKPTNDQVIAVYPDQAVKAGVFTGRGTAECVVKPDGTLDRCRAVEEEPAGKGFGEAAAKLAGSMAIATWSQDGKPVDGALMRIPFRFNYVQPDESKPKP